MPIDHSEGIERATKPNIVFSSTAGGTHDPFRIIASDAAAEEFDVDFVNVPEGSIRASIELIDFTPFFLLLLTPFYTDLYEWVKEKVPLLWRDFFDVNNPDRIQVSVLTARGPKSTKYSAALSIYAKFRYGQVKLVFPDNCTESEMQKSCSEFAVLMRYYSQGETYCGIDLDSELDCYFGIIVVAFMDDENRLRVVNPFAHRSEEAIAQQRHAENLRRSQIKRRTKKIEPYLDPSQPK